MVNQIRVGTTKEFEDLKPKYVSLPGRRTKVAVYRLEGQFYAFLDLCPHQGGPACEGGTVANLEAEILDGGMSFRTFSSKKNYNIVCPWHGVQFDLKSGVCKANTRDKLRSYDVIIENEEVKVKV